MTNNLDKLNILRKINDSRNLTQRSMAKDLGISLGKLNYCLKALKNKGLVKIKNFKNNKNRFNPKSKNNYFYILTPKGMVQKTQLTMNFMNQRLKEYDELQAEIELKKN
jgi:MarR family transcriptional regulator, temperature-dependent positive regulator of motility